MRVFVAGSTGVIGRALLPALVEAGHDVTALVHRFGGHRHLPGEVEKVWSDAFDRAWMISTLEAFRPEAVVNMLTAIPAEVNPRRLAEDFLVPNRLRTVGTRNLVDAAEAAGARRIVSQSVAYLYDPSSEDAAREDALTWRTPPVQFAPVLEALRYLERLTTLSPGGLVLRLGHLY